MNLELLRKASDTAGFLRSELQELYSQATSVDNKRLIVAWVYQAADIEAEISKLRNEAERGAK
jgi:hypothetical protein